MKGSTRYRRTRQRLNLVIVAANACGAALTIFYFRGVHSLQLQGIAADLSWAVGITVLLTAGLLALGTVLALRRLALLWAWYLQATKSDEPEPPPPQVRRLALNLSVIWAGTTLGMWLLAGLFNSSFYSFNPATRRFDWAIFGLQLLGVSGIAGPITSVLVYFAIERIWQPELPLFFPEEDLTRTPAFRLTVRRRMLVLFVMGAMPLLLLAVLSYSHAVQMADTPQSVALLPRLLRLELFLASVGILVAVVLARTLGASLVEPLETLGRRIAAVQEGNLDERMTVTSNDELGLLAKGFNTMVDGLRREEVIRHLFDRYVTPQVADYAIQHGAELGGQLVEASVLFADIRGFTSLTEQMEPAALIALLNRYFQAVSTVIIEHGGLVNKMGGDSLLAVFGTPLNPADDHPQQAVRAAQGLLGALEAFNQGQVRKGEPTLRIGVGVATGPVLAGNVGSLERLEYTVIGDAVNLASRLEAMTKELDATVLLSETTAATVQKWASLRPIGRVQVRGKQEPVQVYALQTSDSAIERALESV